MPVMRGFEKKKRLWNERDLLCYMVFYGSSPLGRKDSYLQEEWDHMPNVVQVVYFPQPVMTQSLVPFPFPISERAACKKIVSHRKLIYLPLGFSDSALTPGSSLPSSNSRLAPPPVDT